MNSKQKKIFIATGIVIVLMGFFPPWTQSMNYSGQHLSAHLGYAFIFTPPKSIISGFNGKINVVTLLVQWATVAFLGGSLVYYYKQD